MSRCSSTAPGKAIRGSTAVLGLAIATVLVTCLPLPLYAQSQAIDGTIEGFVRVENKPLAGAKVQAINTRTGYERDVVADEEGRYRLPLLPPGEYVVLAAMDGYATVSRENLVLRAGEALTIEFDMSSTQFSETVQVSGQSPTVEVARTVVSNTYDEKLVRSVPTIGRSIMDFFTLQPGVNARPLSTGGSGTGTPTTTYGGLGLRQMNVDGVSNNLQGGARNVVISQEAVEEFQTVTNFSAEFGRVAGGLQNAITRSGSNAWHGSALLFTRQKFLSAQRFLLPPGAPKPEFSRYNYGNTMSGPMVRDRAFFFVSYERWYQDQPTVSTITPQNAALLGIPPANIGAYTSTFRAHTVTARADIQLTPNHRLSGRYNYYYDRESPLGGGLQSRDVAQRFDENPYSYTVQFVSVIRPNLVNEARFLYAIRGISNGVDSPEAPNVNISGIGSFNGNSSGTGISKEKGIHIIENVSLTKGRHALKVGIDLLPVSFNQRTTNINGQFTFGGLPAVPGVRDAVSPLDQFLFTEARRIDPATGLPYSYSRFTQAIGAEFFEATTLNQGYFLQDDIRLTDSVKLNAGLRYERFTRPDSNPNPDLPVSQEFPEDTNNWAPRIGFAWDPFGEGRTVIRGGAGVYYNVVVAQTYNNFLRSNGRDVININVTPTQPGAPAFNRTRVLPATGAAGVVSDVRVMSPDFEDITVYNWFGAFEHEVAPNYSLAVTYQGTRGTKLPVSLNVNLREAGTLPDGRRRWTTVGRPEPRFGNIFVAESIGDQQYHGLITTLTKRLSSGFSFQAAHHVSKTTGAAFTNDFTGFGIFTSPSDPLDLDVDEGPGDYDMRHRFTLTGVVEPIFAGLSGAKAALLNGWQFSTRLIASTGYTFDARTGQDDNGDTIFNDRPNGIGYNAYVLPNYFTFDLRLSRIFPTGRNGRLEVIVEGFNLTNRLNATNVNTNFGPGTIPSATFNQPTAAETPRQFQLAARFSF